MERDPLKDGAAWSAQAVEKLRTLWAEGVSAELISQTLRRSEAEVRAKAAEFKLAQHVKTRH